jgi:hypothetical protein
METRFAAALLFLCLAAGLSAGSRRAPDVSASRGRTDLIQIHERPSRDAAVVLPVDLATPVLPVAAFVAAHSAQRQVPAPLLATRARKAYRFFPTGLSPPFVFADS